MIYPSGSYKVYLATHPVDFRKGMDGLAGYVINKFALDPITGAFWTCRAFVPPQVLVYATFRSKATGLFQPSAECRRRGL